MKRLVLLLVAAALLCGCAALASDRPPGCSGPRRPANPNGSVLAPEATPLPAAALGDPGCGGRP